MEIGRGRRVAFESVGGCSGRYHFECLFAGSSRWQTTLTILFDSSSIAPLIAVLFLHPLLSLNEPQALGIYILFTLPLSLLLSRLYHSHHLWLILSLLCLILRPLMYDIEFISQQRRQFRVLFGADGRLSRVLVLPWVDGFGGGCRVRAHLRRVRGAPPFLHLDHCRRCLFLSFLGCFLAESLHVLDALTHLHIPLCGLQTHVHRWDIVKLRTRSSYRKGGQLQALGQAVREQFVKVQAKDMPGVAQLQGVQTYLVELLAWL